ncbi:MAG: hypothetical protein Q8920_16615 [Bacillota bacterium]|nr:hypothetical protein [Bacillota bacterium]
MNPKQTTGLDLIRKFLTSGLGTPSQRGKNKIQFKLNPGTKKFTSRTPSKVNPLNSLAKGLSSSISGLASTLSRITNKAPKEDYNKIVKNFIPPNTVLLKPQYPLNAEEIQLSDLDGDSANEIIASYRMGNEIKTAVIKKQNNRWNKVSEFSTSDYDTLNYRDVAGMTADGKNQIILGYTSKIKAPSLRAYSFDRNIIKEVFNKNYDRFEVVKKTINKKAKVAVWNKNEAGTYNINLYEWNGQQIESLKDSSAYYKNMVVPHYGVTLRRDPRKVENWYNLSDALVKAGMKMEAQRAISIGMGVDRDSQFKDKFQSLKDLI